MRNQTAVKARAVDIQESLKILRFRYGRKVAFRPIALHRGVRSYLIEGKLFSESQIVSWVEAGRSWRA